MLLFPNKKCLNELLLQKFGGRLVVHAYPPAMVDNHLIHDRLMMVLHLTYGYDIDFSRVLIMRYMTEHSRLPRFSPFPS